jgi:hypothetical protein
LLVISTILSRPLAGTHDARTLYAVDAKGGDCSSAIIQKMSANMFRGTATTAIQKTA